MHTYVDEFYIVHYVASPKLKEEYNIVRLGVVGGGGEEGGPAGSSIE